MCKWIFITHNWTRTVGWIPTYDKHSDLHIFYAQNRHTHHISTLTCKIASYSTLEWMLVASVYLSKANSSYFLWSFSIRSGHNCPYKYFFLWYCWGFFYGGCEWGLLVVVVIAVVVVALCVHFNEYCRCCCIYSKIHSYFASTIYLIPRNLDLPM